MKKETKKLTQNEPYSPPEVVIHELDDDAFQFVVGGCVDDGCGGTTNLNCKCIEPVAV
jgi:hypothetical protein